MQRGVPRQLRIEYEGDYGYDGAGQAEFERGVRQGSVLEAKAGVSLGCPDLTDSGHGVET